CEGLKALLRSKYVAYSVTFDLALLSHRARSDIVLSAQSRGDQSAGIDRIDNNRCAISMVSQHFDRLINAIRISIAVWILGVQRKPVRYEHYRFSSRQV